LKLGHCCKILLDVVLEGDGIELKAEVKLFPHFAIVIGDTFIEKYHIHIINSSIH